MTARPVPFVYHSLGQADLGHVLVESDSVQFKQHQESLVRMGEYGRDEITTEN